MKKTLPFLLLLAAGLRPLLAQPIITTQPVGETNWLGQSASFSVAATGSDPLGYQWQLNQTNLDFQTNSTLTLTNLQATDQGLYRVIVSDSSGVTNSDDVPLMVLGLGEALNATNFVWETFGDCPWTVDPINWAHDGTAAAVGTVQLPGQQSVLQTTVEGPGTLSFWWQVDQPTVGFNYRVKVNGAMVPWAIPQLNWQQQTCYLGSGANLVQWVYTNAGPYTVNGNSSWLDQVSFVPGGTKPFITGEPGSQTQSAGSYVIINASADGTPPLHYQWFFNGVAVDDATNNYYSSEPLTTNDAGGYSFIVTNDYGSATSSVATMDVTVVGPTITTQPLSQVSDGSSVVFYAFASGSPPISFQWYFNGSPLDGKTNGSLAIPEPHTTDAGNYFVLASSPYGSVTSHVATLAVGGVATILSQPTNETLLAGSRAVLTANVSGVGPLKFQWQLNGTNLPNNLITTVAGNGTAGFAGDGGIATAGEVNAPVGVAADSAGNVFIADSNNNRIRKVGTDGLITTVAGDGAPTYGGNGVAATNAALRGANGVAVDSAGNLFIADTSNNRIRKVDANGIITTLAGNGAYAFGGDDGPATNASFRAPQGVAVDGIGNVFIADYGNQRIRKVDTNGIITTIAGKSGSGFSGDGGAATNASLNFPRGVAVDGAGNVFIADLGNERIRKVDIYGTITTIAGNGSSFYSGDGGMATNAAIDPYGVSADDYGDILVVDHNNNRVRRIDPYGIITTVAGTNANGYNGDGIVATNASLSVPTGLAVDSYGRYLIADTINNRVRRFGQGPSLVIDHVTAADAGNYTLIVRSGFAFGSVTSSVASLTVLLPPAIVNPPANQTAGLSSNATFAVTASGTAPLAYQWQMNGTNLPGQIGQSLNLANVQWSDSGNYDVIITNDYGSVTSSVVTLTVGNPPVLVSQPGSQWVVSGTSLALSVAAAGDGPFTYQWQCDGTNLPPIITTVAGTNGYAYSGDGGPAIDAKLNQPEGVAVDSAGNLFIADYANNRVREVDTNGIITTIAGTNTQGNAGNGGPAVNATLYRPSSVIFDASGNLLIGEYGNGDVRKVDTNGIITRVAGTGTQGIFNDGRQALSTAFSTVADIALDTNGNIYVSENAHCRIRKIATNGIVSTTAGNTFSVTGGFSGDGGLGTNAQLNTPLSIAIDPSGNQVFADSSNYRVRKVDTNEIITTIAGTGGYGYNGDNKAATNANLWPYSIAFDKTGNLYIAEQSGRIRKVDAGGIITTVAGGSGPGFVVDGGPATGGTLSFLHGLTFDKYGNMYFADGGRIRKVHFAGDPTLALPNVSLTNAGSYRVIVTSPYGSVMSSNLTLSVIVPPAISAITTSNGIFNFAWTAQPSFSYQLQYATNLVAPVWQDLGSPITATNGTVNTTDVPGADAQRFYRLHWVPQTGP